MITVIAGALVAVLVFVGLVGVLLVAVKGDRT